MVAVSMNNLPFIILKEIFKFLYLDEIWRLRRVSTRFFEANLLTPKKILRSIEDASTQIRSAKSLAKYISGFDNLLNMFSKSNPSSLRVLEVWDVIPPFVVFENVTELVVVGLLPIEPRQFPQLKKLSITFPHLRPFTIYCDTLLHLREVSHQEYKRTINNFPLLESLRIDDVIVYRTSHPMNWKLPVPHIYLKHLSIPWLLWDSLEWAPNLESIELKQFVNNSQNGFALFKCSALTKIETGFSRYVCKFPSGALKTVVETLLDESTEFFCATPNSHTTSVRRIGSNRLILPWSDYLELSDPLYYDNGLSLAQEEKNMMLLRDLGMKPDIVDINGLGTKVTRRYFDFLHREMESVFENVTTLFTDADTYRLSLHINSIRDPLSILTMFPNLLTLQITIDDNSINSMTPYVSNIKKLRRLRINDISPGSNVSPNHYIINSELQSLQNLRIFTYIGEVWYELLQLLVHGSSMPMLNDLEIRPHTLENVSCPQKNKTYARIPRHYPHLRKLALPMIDDETVDVLSNKLYSLTFITSWDLLVIKREITNIENDQHNKKYCQSHICRNTMWY